MPSPRPITPAAVAPVTSPAAAATAADAPNPTASANGDSGSIAATMPPDTGAIRVDGQDDSCISIRADATDSWCAVTCAHAQCPPGTENLCKCGADAEALTKAAKGAAEKSAAAEKAAAKAAEQAAGKAAEKAAAEAKSATQQ